MEPNVRVVQRGRSFSKGNSDVVSKNLLLRAKYEDLIQDQNEHPENYKSNLAKLKNWILIDGIPPDTEEERLNSSKKCSLRGRIWQILLKVPKVDAQFYIDCVNKGPCSEYQKLRQDTFRTFASNQSFCERVPEHLLIRVLNAFLHSLGPNDNITYVQGMNVLLAPFLYLMPEVDAFYTFKQFAQKCIPLYLNAGITAAYTGMRMIDEILKIVDPELFNYLTMKNLKADFYSMPPVLSFSACTPPLEELLKLWDFYFAFGCHLNIVSVVAQIVLEREELIKSETPNALLRTLPPINAAAIISLCSQLVAQLPIDIYDQVVCHPYLVRKIEQRRSSLSSLTPQIRYSRNNISSTSLRDTSNSPRRDPTSPRKQLQQQRDHLNV